MLLGAHRFLAGWLQAAARGQSQRQRTRAIDFMHVIDDSLFPLLRCLEQHGTRAIAEEDAGGAVGVVDHGAERVGADDQHFRLGATLDQLGADLQRVQKTGAGGAQVKAPRMVRAELLLHQAGGRGEGHVRTHGRDDDDFDFLGRDASIGQAATRCFDREVTGGGTLGRDMAFADAGALDNPLVRGVDHLFEVSVGQDARRDIGSECGDLGALGKLPLPAFQSIQTQGSSPENKG